MAPFEGITGMEEIGRMIADAGMAMHRAGSLLDSFINEMFSEDRLESVDLDGEFRFAEGLETPSVRLTKILWDTASSSVVVITEGNITIPWEGITLGAKSLIVDQVHLRMLSDDLYRNLRNQ